MMLFRGVHDAGSKVSSLVWYWKRSLLKALRSESMTPMQNLATRKASQPMSNASTSSVDSVALPSFKALSAEPSFSLDRPAVVVVEVVAVVRVVIEAVAGVTRVVVVVVTVAAAIEGIVALCGRFSLALAFEMLTIRGSGLLSLRWQKSAAEATIKC